MNDLKQRLNLFSSNPVFGGIIEEAKTRIEQLEAENKRLREALEAVQASKENAWILVESALNV